MDFCSIDWGVFGRYAETRIRKRILHYRALYIITTESNLAFGRIMLPFMKLSIMILFTACFFTVLRFHDHLNFLSLALVSLLTWVTIWLLIPTTIIMSSLYKTSKNFIRNLEPCIRNLNETEPRKVVLQRQLISCGLIRCEVGGLYYMEAKAKLTVIHKLVSALKYLLVNVKA